MFIFSFIRGISVGLEYGDTDDLGFVIVCSLGIIRLAWYTEVTMFNDDDEE